MGRGYASCIDRGCGSAPWVRVLQKGWAQAVVNGLRKFAQPSSFQVLRGAVPNRGQQRPGRVVAGPCPGRRPNRSAPTAIRAAPRPTPRNAPVASRHRRLADTLTAGHRSHFGIDHRTLPAAWLAGVRHRARGSHLRTTVQLSPSHRGGCLSLQVACPRRTWTCLETRAAHRTGPGLRRDNPRAPCVPMPGVPKRCRAQPWKYVEDLVGAGASDSSGWAGAHERLHGELGQPDSDEPSHFPTPSAHDRETRIWSKRRCPGTRGSRLAFSRGHQAHDVVAGCVGTEQSQDRGSRGRFSGEAGTAVGVDGLLSRFTLPACEFRPSSGEARPLAGQRAAQRPRSRLCVSRRSRR